MSLKSIFNNIRKRGLKDVLNPERREMYRTGKDIKKNGIHLQYNEIIPYAEQLVYRTIVCNDCLRAGSCKICGCEMPSSMMTPSFPCEGENFDPMKSVRKDPRDDPKEQLSPAEWEEYKKERGLRFLIDYRK